MRRSLPSVRSALGWAALLLMCAWAAVAVPFLDKCVQHRTYPFSLHQNHSIYADVNTSPMSTSTLHVEGAVTLISHNVEKDFCVYHMTVAFTSRVNVSGSESSTLPSTASDEEHLRHFMASWADVQSMTRVQPVIFKQALSGEISDVHIPYPGDSQNTAGIKMAVEALLDQLSFSASHIGEAARVTTKEVDNFDEDTGSSTPLVLSMSDKYSVDLSKSGVRAYRFERDVFPAHGPTGPQSAPHMVNRREITETFVRPGHPGFALSLHKTVVASVRSGDIINAEDLEWASGSEGPFGGSFGFRMESVTILGSASDFAAEVAEFVNEPIVFEPREIDVSALSPSGSDPAKSNDEFSPFDETDETLTTGRDAADDEEEEEGLYDAVQTEADRRETGGLDIFSDQEEKPSDVQYPSLLSVRERSGDLTEKQRRRLARANMRLRSSRTYATASESSSFGFNPKAEQSEESSRATWEHSSVGSESSFSSSSARSSSSSGEIGVEKVNYKTVFEKRVWFGGVKDMLGYFDGGIRAAAWELNDQKVIDLGIVFDIGAMFWGQQFSVIRAIPGSRLFMNTRKAKWTLNIEEPHRPEALRMVRSLFGFSFPVEEDPRKPQDKFPECGPKPGPYLKRTLDEYYYARKVPKKVENRFGCISGIRLSLYVWGVGTQVKVKMNLEPKFRMASDVCEQDDFNADTPPRFAAIGGQIDGQVTAQIFICAVNAAHGMQVLSPSKCNFPLRGPTVGRGSLTLIDFSWKVSYNAAVDDLLSGCISSVADVKHFGGKIALTREALEGRKWENALFSQDLQPSCPKALQSLRRTWCIKGKQTKMVGNGTVDATGPPGIDETARQLGLLVRCSPADEYSSRLPGMRPLWFKRHTATGKWQWTPFEPGMRKRLRKWMFVNETSVSPTAKKWPNKPLLAQNVQLVRILNGTYNETEPLATQLGMVRCTLADYCFHPRLDSTIWLRKVNSSWFWTPLDPTFIRRNKYWLPVSTTLIPETYPMWKSTTPTDAVLRVLKSLQTGRLMALASSLSSSSASSSAESSEFSESSSGSSRSSSSRSSSSQSLSSASAIPAAVKPTPGTGVIETNPKDRIARALRLTFMNGEFVDRKCLEDVLCDPIWFRKEHNQWWWTPYPPTHKRRQWFSTNIVRVPDDAPKPWTGRIPPDNDVKMIRVFARAAILGNADAKPAPIKQKAKRNKKKRL